MRFPVEPGTAIEVNHLGVPARANTLDISFNGILLEFDHPVTLHLGDWVTLDFVQDDPRALPLPYWGVGQIVRIEDNKVALNFDIEQLVALNWPEAEDSQSVEADAPLET